MIVSKITSILYYTFALVFHTRWPISKVISNNFKTITKKLLNKCLLQRALYYYYWMYKMFKKSGDTNLLKNEIIRKCPVFFGQFWIPWIKITHNDISVISLCQPKTISLKITSNFKILINLENHMRTLSKSYNWFFCSFLTRNKFPFFIILSWMSIMILKQIFINNIFSAYKTIKNISFSIRFLFK